MASAGYFAFTVITRSKSSGVMALIGVYGITQSAFLVFTANAFALLGLRALYFLVEGLLERLVYLTIG
ncbi:hypothetical protein E1281_34925, partial [Actinomadura sp. KC345]